MNAFNDTDPYDPNSDTEFDAANFINWEDDETISESLLINNPSPSLMRRLKESKDVRALLEKANEAYEASGRVGSPEDYSGFFDAMSESYVGASYDTLVGDVARFSQAPGHIDPEFKVTPAYFQQMAPRLTERDYAQLRNAPNEMNFLVRAENLIKINEHRERLDKSGAWTKWSALIASGLLDPSFLLLNMGGYAALGGPKLAMKTGLAGRPALEAGKVGRWHGAVRGGTLTTATDGGLEILRANISDAHTFEDAALAVAISGAAGAGFGGLMPRSTVNKAWDKASKEMLAKELVEAEATGMLTRTAKGALAIVEDNGEAVPITSSHQINRQINSLQSKVNRWNQITKKAKKDEQVPLLNIFAERMSELSDEEIIRMAQDAGVNNKFVRGVKKGRDKTRDELVKEMRRKWIKGAVENPMEHWWKTVVHGNPFEKLSDEAAEQLTPVWNELDGLMKTYHRAIGPTEKADAAAKIEGIIKRNFEEDALDTMRKEGVSLDDEFTEASIRTEVDNETEVVEANINFLEAIKRQVDEGDIEGAEANFSRWNNEAIEAGEDSAGNTTIGFQGIDHSHVEITDLLMDLTYKWEEGDMGEALTTAINRLHDEVDGLQQIVHGDDATAFQLRMDEAGQPARDLISGLDDLLIDTMETLKEGNYLREAYTSKASQSQAVSTRHSNRIKELEQRKRSAEDLEAKARGEEGRDSMDILGAADSAAIHMETEAFDPTKENIFGKIFGWFDKYTFTGSRAGRLISSKNPLVRKLGAMLGDDPLLRNAYPTVARAHQRATALLTDLHQKLEPLRQQLRKEMGLTGVNSYGWRQTVNRVIMDGVRSPRTLEEVAGAEGDAIRLIRGYYSKMRDWGIERGSLDENIPENLSYMTRRGNQALINQMMDQDGGEQQLINLVKRAFINGSEDMEVGVDLDERIAERFAKRWLKGQSGHESAKMIKLRDQDAGALRDQLRKELGSEDYTDEMMDDIIEVLIPEKDVSRTGQVSPALRRMNLDETTELDGLKFTDLLDNDLDSILDSYTRRIVGNGEWRATAKALGGVDAEGNAILSTLEDVIKYVGKDSGIRGADQGDVRVITGLYRDMHGMRIHDYGNQKSTEGLLTLGRGLRDLMFLRVMNQVGIAQIPEIANLTSQNGLKAIHHMTALKNMARDARSGMLKGELCAELEAVTGGLCSDMLRRVHVNRLDQGYDYRGAPNLEGVGGGAAAARRTYQQAVNGLKEITYKNPIGIGWIDRWLRTSAMTSSAEHFLNDIAVVGKKGVAEFKEGWRVKTKQRLNDIGFSDEEIQKITNILSKKGVIEVVPSTYNSSFSVLKLNLGAWGDDVLADNFCFNIYRHVNRVIQRTSASDVSGWMDHEVGKILMEFRSFMWVSRNKQLGYNLRRIDQRSIEMFLGTTFLGTLAYYGQTLSKTMGMNEDQRHEFLNNRLYSGSWDDLDSYKWDVMIAAGVSRSGWASVLIPTYASIANFMGNEAILGPGTRSSGLGTGWMDGFPVGDYILELIETTSGMTKAFMGVPGESISQEDIKGLVKLLPMQNIFGVQQGLDYILDQLGIPDRD